MIIYVRVAGLSVPPQFRHKISASGTVSTLHDWRVAPDRSAHARTGPNTRDTATDTSARPIREAGRRAQCGHGGDDLACCQACEPDITEV